MSFWKDALMPRWSSMGVVPQHVAQGLQGMPQSLQQGLGVSPQVANALTPNMGMAAGMPTPNTSGPMGQQPLKVPSAQMLVQQLRADARGPGG